MSLQTDRLDNPSPHSNATSATRKRARLRFPGGSRLIAPVSAIVLVLLFNFFFTPGFFHFRLIDGRLHGSLITILHRGAPVMLLSLGMAVVIATGGIDLSVGAVMAIAGATAAVLIARPPASILSHINVHHSTAAVIAIALGVAILCGLWNGVLVALLDVQPIVATLILMVAGRGIAQLLAQGQIVTFNDPHFAFLAAGTFLSLPFTITIVAATTIFAGLLTRGTALGLFLESVGNNPTASRFAGVNARRVTLIAYVFCGLCAGLAGLIATADIQAADANNVGLYLELDAILAASIGGASLMGGRFSLLGSLLGAIVMQSLTTTILAHGVRREITLMIEAGVVILVCLIQSDKFRAMFARGLPRRRS